MSDQAELWKDGRFIENKWSYLSDGISRKDGLIVTLEEWRDHDWSRHEKPLGLIVRPGDDLDEVASHLEQFDLVVVHFPAFSNGTAFSIARIIRDKLSFDGEIRAAGAYILDQMPMLERCGVTSFEVSSPALKAGLERDLWPDMSRYYQHALDGNSNKSWVRVMDTKRPWLSQTLNVIVDDARFVA